jgi:hypothetical protein
MEKRFFSYNDKFRLEFKLEESEIRYLSQFESVNFIYPLGFINSDSDKIFYSTLNVPELLRKIKSEKDENNKLKNKVMDFFGINR